MTDTAIWQKIENKWILLGLGVDSSLPMSLSSDLGYAFRTLRKSPAFTVTAIGALAMGIGANAAIFSLADALLLRPLPLAQPDRLVEAWEDGPAL
jgi:hypothetical protein